MTYNAPAIAPRGQAKPNTEIFRLLAARMGLDDPCFRASDEEMLAELFAGDAGRRGRWTSCAARGWMKVDLGQGPAPHADGGFGTPDGKLALRADRLAERGHRPAALLRPAGRGRPTPSSRGATRSR